jgi:membrane associated rhomboid family serine protease
MSDTPGRGSGLYPFLTAALVVLSLVAFFIWQLGFGVDESVQEAGFPPSDWAGLAPHRREHYVLSTFMHGGIFHVLANMGVLWVFGSRLERLMGPFKFALIYIAAGYAGLRVHVRLDTQSIVPMVGAGGAISGVLGAWLALHRRARLDSLLRDRLPAPLADLPLWTTALLWIALQALSHAICTAHYGTVPAYAELLAGLGTGAAATLVLKPTPRRGMPATESR